MPSAFPKEPVRHVESAYWHVPQIPIAYVLSSRFVRLCCFPGWPPPQPAPSSWRASGITLDLHLGPTPPGPMGILLRAQKSSKLRMHYAFRHGPASLQKQNERSQGIELTSYMWPCSPKTQRRPKKRKRNTQQKNASAVPWQATAST